MTQLDRLEALADLDSWLGQELRDVRLYLPDLIQVARAAKEFCAIYEQRFNEAEAASKMIFPSTAFEDLYNRVVPLFAEVES